MTLISNQKRTDSRSFFCFLAVLYLALNLERLNIVIHLHHGVVGSRLQLLETQVAPRIVGDFTGSISSMIELINAASARHRNIDGYAY